MNENESNKSSFETIFLILIVVIGIGGTTLYGLHFFRSNYAVTRPQDRCINNLRLMENAKDLWAGEHQKSTNAAMTWDDVTPYLKTKPICPSGGTYTLNVIGANPTCSIGGKHVLP